MFPSQIRLRNPEMHSYTLEIHPLAYWSAAPIPVESDRCLIRLVNTCEDDALECSQPSINGKFREIGEVCATVLSIESHCICCCDSGSWKATDDCLLLARARLHW